MSNASNSPFFLPSFVDSLPLTKQTAAAAAASNGRHLSIHPKPAPFTPLSLSLSTVCQRLHDSVVKFASSDRLPPLNNSNLQNPKKPPFPLHGAVKIFEVFTDLFSNLISKNPLFIRNNRHGGGGGEISRRLGDGAESNHNFWSHVFCPPAIAKEDKKSEAWDSHDLQANLVVQLNKLSRFKRYKVSCIKFLNPRTRSVVNGADESFGDMVTIEPGGLYTKHELMEKLSLLSSSELFEKIEFDAKTNPDGSIEINIPFKEKIFPSKTKFRCVAFGSIPEEKPIEMDPNMTEKEKVEYMTRMSRQYRKRIESGQGCILPDKLQEEIESMLVKSASVSASLLKKIQRKINKWYHDNEYLVAQVVNFGNPEAHPRGEIIFEVLEGEIEKINVKFVDKLGNVCQGNTDVRLIDRILPEEVAVGKIFNMRAFNEAKQNLEALDLFSHSEMIAQPNEKNGALSVDISLQEHPQKWSKVDTEWNIVPGRNRRPTLASMQPGATISFGHRNIKGLNRSFQGAITLSNLFDPQDDIGFNFEYNHPYIDGLDDPRNRKFQTTCFNSRKLSPVFRGGPGVEDTPIWVDRFGVKANITEDFTRQSKFTYGLVVEDVKTRGEGGDIVKRGDRVSVSGQSIANGPPTTLSGTGVDRMAFLQANLTRDNTRFVNGAVVGERDVFQVDQGLLGAFFNRHRLSISRFIPLKKVEEGKGKAPPPVLALHGLYGGCVGDLPNHEAFTIGGPYSVRGYSMGEIGASRNKLEVAAEVRVPVKGTYAYAFAEHGNDLGSSVGVQGNPTKSYMRKGNGSSYGAGIKLGQLRAEYAVDNNNSTGAFFFHFGDRF